MFTIAKPSWFTIILMITVLILGIILYFGSCNKPIKQPDTHLADSTTIKAMADLKESKKRIDSLAGIASFWHSKYDSAWQAIQQAARIISLKESKIRSLIDSNIYFKSVNDTLSQLTNCGEIMDQVQGLLSIIDVQRIAIDSIHRDTDSALTVQNVIVSDLRAQLIILQGQLLSIKGDYDALVKQNKKTINRLKLEDIVAKVGTIAAAILSITVLIKK